MSSNTQINVSALVPWNLTLSFGGDPYATKMPTWADVIVLGKAEKALKAMAELPPDEQKAIDGFLRDGLKRFFPVEIHEAVDAAGWDDVQAAFVAASAYFGEWLKKKQIAAKEAALAAAGFGRSKCTSAPGKSS